MRFLLLFALTSCASVLTPADWRSTPPADAPCEVTETYTDGMGTDRRISKWSADGRLVFAQTRLTYHGNGFEHFTWSDGRIVRIDSYYENAGMDIGCAVEGGCAEPAQRTVTQTRLRYDAANRLISEEVDEIEYRERDGEWTEHDSKGSDRDYAYSGDWLIASGGAAFSFKDGRPVTRNYDGRTSTFEWQNGRLVTYRWFDYVQTFDYDTAGRLVRETLTQPEQSSDLPQITEWTYDPAGLLVATVKKHPHHEYPTAWTYDVLGRVLSEASNGQVRRAFAYSSACPANLRVLRPPTAEHQAGLDVCIRSPGYAYDSCFYQYLR